MQGLRQFWTNLGSSLWFIPSLIVAGSIGLAIALIEVSAAIDTEVLDEWPRLFGAGEDGSRELLGAIAMAMITVTGVVFSITVLTLSQASFQYTPRILRNFMSSRAVQVVLGVFAGIFTYCLIVLRTIRGGDDPTVHPVAVFGAVVLALIGVGVLIFFIHYVASSLQASNIIGEASHATREAIDTLFPEELGEGADEERPEDVRPGAPWVTIPAAASGYVQRVETERMIDFARRRDVLLRMERGVGEFVVEGVPLVSVAGGTADEETAKALNGMFLIDTSRTIEQDAAFGIRQIVDIALKGLSPSVNDETTAVTCIDHLAVLLARLARRRIEPPLRKDGGHVRVIARGPSFESLLNESLDQIRRNAVGKVSVIVRLLWCIEAVAACTTSLRRRRALALHLKLLAGMLEGAEPERDLPILETQVRRAGERLGVGMGNLERLASEPEGAPGNRRQG
jgi:uncharacterized membrane protein